MDFLYVKSLHIIFVVAWFASLFYLVRLFIYNAEAQSKDEIARPILTRQFSIMQNRLLFIIGWPSAVATFIFGFWMIWLNTAYLSMPWMWLKLCSVFLLLLYHIQCHRINREQQAGIYRCGSFKLRLFNEVATLLLIAIVFLVVLKSNSDFVKGMLGTIVVGVLLFLAAYYYKQKRKKQELNETEKASNETTETNQPS